MKNAKKNEGLDSDAKHRTDHATKETLKEY